ncbi:TPA: hypothetical protein QBH20_004191 [Escherichia coli]|nr:hypothetical protein [Escherichia coli]
MTVYRNNKSNDISHQIIQYLLRKNESCCTAEIARALHLSVYQARYYLQQLEPPHTTVAQQQLSTTDEK